MGIQSHRPSNLCWFFFREISIFPFCTSVLSSVSAWIFLHLNTQQPFQDSPLNCPNRILQARILEQLAMLFSDLPDPGIEPGSPALQVDSLPSEPPGKLREEHTDNNLRNSLPGFEVTSHTCSLQPIAMLPFQILFSNLKSSSILNCYSYCASTPMSCLKPPGSQPPKC